MSKETKEEIIAILSEMRSGYNCFDANEEPKYRALSTAIKAIEDSRWIPVTERLPDKELKKYVVTLDNGEVENRWWMGCFWTERVGRVIAWMPLPERYEEEKNELDSTNGRR